MITLLFGYETGKQHYYTLMRTLVEWLDIPSIMHLATVVSSYRILKKIILVLKKAFFNIKKCSLNLYENLILSFLF